MATLRHDVKRGRAVDSVYPKITVQREDAMESLRFGGSNKRSIGKVHRSIDVLLHQGSHPYGLSIRRKVNP